MVDFKLCGQRVHHVIIKILGITHYDRLRQATSVDDVILDEIGYLGFSQVCERDGLHPFCEVINSHENESMSIGPFCVNHTNCVIAPH